MDTLLTTYFEDQAKRTDYATHMLTCIIAGFRSEIRDAIDDYRAFTLQAYNKKFNAHDAVMSLYAKGQSVTADKLLDYAVRHVLPKTKDMPHEIVRGMECLSEYLGHCKTILGNCDIVHLTEKKIAHTARQARHLVDNSPHYSRNRFFELVSDE